MPFAAVSAFSVVRFLCQDNALQATGGVFWRSTDCLLVKAQKAEKPYHHPHQLLGNARGPIAHAVRTKNSSALRRLRILLILKSDGVFGMTRGFPEGAEFASQVFCGTSSIKTYRADPNKSGSDPNPPPSRNRRRFWVCCL